MKPCASCAYATHVLTSATEYFVNKRSLPFAEFRSFAENLRADEDTARTVFVGVYVDVETGRVNRVTLLHRDQ